MMKYILFVFASFTILSASAQDCFTTAREVIEVIRADVEFLADDRLEGRAPGTAGMDVAREYIAKRMTKAGLIPMGEASSFYQRFMVPEPVRVQADQTYLVVSADTLTLNNQYFAVLQSANGQAMAKTQWVGFGINSPENDYNDYKKIKDLTGKIAVMDVSSPDGIHPHSKYVRYHDLNARIELAKGKGAIGVILVNLGEMANDPQTSYRAIRSTGIPVLFLADDKVGAKLKKSKQVSFSVQQSEVNVAAYNVIGYVDNGKPTTIVIGAHYDHLGWGGEGSRALGEHAIHNGADDNASGTAAMLALADHLGTKQNLNGHNYLFIAFSAEERGLLGSNFFVKQPTYDLEQIAFMINMDMVGRLRDGMLQVSGTGTAAQWKEVFEALVCDGLEFKLDPSGIGPSDHTSFYNQSIPVLHFFTGSHDDYHKPSDDADKLNYKGIGHVMGVILAVLNAVDQEIKLEFRETKKETSRSVPAFSVTMGVMPDYLYEDGGLRIDGVTPEKPAAAAGLQKGDIITEIGDFVIADIYAYMNALSAFKKGDKVKIVYLREGEKRETELTF